MKACGEEMRQKKSRKIYFNSQPRTKPLPERGVAPLLELYSVLKEHSWHWKTGICVQLEKLQAVHRNRKELLYINVLTSTVLFILNYAFVNGLMWLNSQVNKQIFVPVNQNKEILHAFMEFCNSVFLKQILLHEQEFWCQIFFLFTFGFWNAIWMNKVLWVYVGSRCSEEKAHWKSWEHYWRFDDSTLLETHKLLQIQNKDILTNLQIAIRSSLNYLSLKVAK